MKNNIHDKPTDPVHETDYQRFARLYPDDDSFAVRDALCRETITAAAHAALLTSGDPVGQANEDAVMLDFQRAWHRAYVARRRNAGQPVKKPSPFRPVFLPVALLEIAYPVDGAEAIRHGVAAWHVAWLDAQCDLVNNGLAEHKIIAIALSDVAASLDGRPWPSKVAQEGRATGG